LEESEYGETFAATVSQDSLRVVLANATQQNLVIHQMDVQTAFLNGKIDREVKIELPDLLYSKKHKITTVGKLQKSLYGLRQAPAIWAKTLSVCLIENNFKPTNVDPCVFTNLTAGVSSLIAVYVDDLLICARDESEMN
jgi:Reverse transcriptase (RNA-dependent DNA polymerase)